ncbi:predicted protein [Streptomyces filamentosus NRRL 15998]|uniref:Predicted protein n=1 Tax=Streptomyces filamentosus NRRL 15998 TaxID=457431 RepID=D6AIN2_STRFL|nr:predicted protein [Streptomyces filamentosus NRRL 15998]
MGWREGRYRRAEGEATARPRTQDDLRCARNTLHGFPVVLGLVYS